jgi:hypothetical protein
VSTAPAQPSPASAPGRPAEACPLCGAPLAPEQEWCLRCGAAARTRLAAAPNWRGPIVAVAVLAALALGVLAASLVKLAGDSGPAPAASTTTVTTTTPGTPLATTPTVGAGAPSTPGAATTVPGTSTPTTGATTLGTSTATTPPATVGGAAAGGAAAP